MQKKGYGKLKQQMAVNIQVRKSLQKVFRSLDWSHINIILPDMPVIYQISVANRIPGIFGIIICL